MPPARCKEDSQTRYLRHVLGGNERKQRFLIPEFWLQMDRSGRSGVASLGPGVCDGACRAAGLDKKMKRIGQMNIEDT